MKNYLIRYSSTGPAGSYSSHAVVTGVACKLDALAHFMSNHPAARALIGISWVRVLAGPTPNS